MAAKGGRIDFMFLGPPLTRPLDPLLTLRGGGGVHFALWPLDPVDLLYAQRRSIELELGSANADLECGPGISGGSRISPRLGGAKPPYDFAKFPQKLHEIESIWTGGALVLRAPLDPPMGIKGRGR